MGTTLHHHRSPSLASGVLPLRVMDASKTPLKQTSLRKEGSPPFGGGNAEAEAEAEAEARVVKEKKEKERMITGAGAGGVQSCYP